VHVLEGEAATGRQVEGGDDIAARVASDHLLGVAIRQHPRGEGQRRGHRAGGHEQARAPGRYARARYFAASS
jgi:hypothetical protein